MKKRENLINIYNSYIYIYIYMATFNGNLKIPNGGKIGSEGDDDAITITSDGKVGIGITNPQTKLAFDSSQGEVITFGTNYRAGIGSTHILNDGERLDFYAGSNAAYGRKMSLTAGGTLGIQSGEDNDTILSMETANSQGGFQFRWNGSTNNYNMNVFMKDDTDPYSYHQIGRFENDDAGTGTFFTGQHRNIVNRNITQNEIGLIVSSTDRIINVDGRLMPSINESLPFCQITNIDNDKKVFGVISDREDEDEYRSTGTGSFKTTTRKAYRNDRRMYINSVGEGAMWVSNKNGSIEIGDYISSSSVNGYGMKQTLEENRLMNYTVAKVTCDCDFSLTKIVKQKLKTVTITGTTTYTEIDYDENGDVQYEDDLDENGNQQMMYKYETRFLQADGTQLLDETDYNTRLGNGETVYIACFVGCTYHCG
jgi:hypothetical protein